MTDSSLTIDFSLCPSDFAANVITFKSPLNQGVPIRSTRGALSRDWSSDRCFRWTSAVCALAYLAVAYRQSAHGGEIEQAFLCGKANSMACSLDYALTKKPGWLMDVFGSDSKGNPLAMRLFDRRNSSRKMPGPVLVRFNPYQLRAEGIVISVNGRVIASESELSEIKERLAATWREKFTRVSVSQEVTLQPLAA